MFLFREIFMKNLRNIFKKGLVNGQLSSYGPCWGTRRGFVYWEFERKRKCRSGFLFVGPRGH
jgi:hypothetical protein